jgi:hypothetical protein
VPLQPEDLLTPRNATATATAPAPVATAKSEATKSTYVSPAANKSPASPSALHATRIDLAAEVLHRFGEVRFAAYGSSMVPSIYPGDLLTVRSHDVAAARRGEIVLFLLGGRPYVHRITRKWPERNRVIFATRGDALPKEDPSVDASQLLGRVTAIKRCGKFITIVVKPGLFTRAARWAARNSVAFTRLLLLVHHMRMRLSGRSTDFADPSANHIQEFAQPGLQG